MKFSFLLPALAFCLCLPCADAQTADKPGLYKVNTNALLKKPVLFADLGKTIATPDAMALDKQGRLYLSVPNFAGYELYGSRICRFNASNQPETWLDSLPKHAETNRVHPMGMDFGPDGNLYIADAQPSANGKNRARVLRVVIKDGKPLRTDVVVEGLHSANGVKWFNQRIYISDSYLQVEGKKNQSAIFSFSLEEMNRGKVQVNASPAADPHLLCSFTSKVFNNKEDQGGVDGIAFDKRGVLYAGNFSDGVISRIELDAAGKVRSQRIVVDSDSFRCCDGMFYDKSRDCMYIANFHNNSVHRLDLTRQQLDLLWENGDATGADGQLDQPCEPIVYKGRLIVVNFDSFAAFKNKQADEFHTMSAFELR